MHVCTKHKQLVGGGTIENACGAAFDPEPWCDCEAFEETPEEAELLKPGRHPGSRWELLEHTTPSGKLLYRCIVCRRETPTPDKTCRSRCESEEAILAKLEALEERIKRLRSRLGKEIAGQEEMLEKAKERLISAAVSWVDGDSAFPVEDVLGGVDLSDLLPFVFATKQDPNGHVWRVDISCDELGPPGPDWCDCGAMAGQPEADQPCAYDPAVHG